MQQDLFLILIEKYLAGKSGEHEKLLLEEYYSRLSGSPISKLENDDAEALQDLLIARLEQQISISKQPIVNKTTRVYSISGKWWAVAVVVILLGAATGLFIRNNKNGAANQQVLAVKTTDTPQKAATNTLINPAGSKVLTATLADGTKVWLNGGSTLSFPVPFSASERKLVLTGEAYFEVVHDSKQPFRVVAKNLLIEDVGTKFNVNASLPDPAVTLIEGAIKINNTLLSPGSMYSNGIVSRTDIASVLRWKNDTISSQVVEHFNRFPKEAALSFEELMKFDEGRTWHLYPTDSTLIVPVTEAGRSGYFFYEYSLKTKGLVAEYIKQGTKPGEVESILSTGLYKNNTLWVNDVGTNRIVTMTLKNGRDSSKVKEYHIPDNFYYSVQLMGGEKLLTSGVWRRNTPFQIQELDLKTDKLLTEYGVFTAPRPDSMPYYAWKGAYESFLYLKPTEDKAVLARRFTDELEIFDRATKKSVVVRGPENFAPAMRVGKNQQKDVAIRTDQTRFAFINGKTTNKYIYLLYSGEYQKKYDEKIISPGTYGTRLYVYDWNGKPIAMYNLGRKIAGFGISNDDHELYAYDIENKFILKAKLKNEK